MRKIVVGLIDIMYGSFSLERSVLTSSVEGKIKRVQGSVRSGCFLGLSDPDPLVRGADLASDPSTVKQNSKKNLGSYCFVNSL